MIKLKENFVIDNNGNRIGVFLDIKEYQKLLEMLEELESIRIYDEIKETNDEAVPFEDAVIAIENKRK